MRLPRSTGLTDKVESTSTDQFPETVMLRSLSKLWASTSSQDTSSVRERPSPPGTSAAVPAETPTTPTPTNPDTDSESKPLPPPPVSLHPLARSTSFGSAHTLEKFRTTGPSHISWRTTPSASATSVSGTGSPSVTPSPSRPNFQSTASVDVVSTRVEHTPEDPANTPVLRDGIWRIPSSVANAVLGTGTPPSPVGSGSGAATPGSRRLSAESGSLHLQSIYVSDTDSNSALSSGAVGGDQNGVQGGQSIDGRAPSKLSPIAETGSSPNESADTSKVLGSPEHESEQSTIKRYSDPFATPSIPLTPNSSATLTSPTPTQTPTTPMTPMQNTPTTPVQHQAFLTRTVKRSISQSSSTGTFFTPTSAVPPSSILTSSTHSHGHSPIPQTPISATTNTSHLTMATAGHLHVSPPSTPTPGTPATPRPYLSHNLTKPLQSQTQSRAPTPPAPASSSQPTEPRPALSGPPSHPTAPTFQLQFSFPTSARRVHLAAPPSLPTVLGSPPVSTRPLPGILDVEIDGQPYPHTTVSVIYEGSERLGQRESVGTTTRSLGTGRWRESGPGRWRDSGRSATSFFTAPSVRFEGDDDGELEDTTGDDIGGGDRDSRAEEIQHSRAFCGEQEADLGIGADDESWTYEDLLGQDRDHHKAHSPDEYDCGDSQSHMSLPDGYCDVVNEPLSRAASSSGVLVSRGNSNDDGTGQNTRANARPLGEKEMLGEERVRSWASELMHVPLDAADDVPNEDSHPYPYDIGNDGETVYTRRSSTFAEPHDHQELFSRPNGHARIHSDTSSSIMETMSRHENGSVITDSDATAVEQRIQARWFEARGVSWGSFRSFRDSIYVYARTRWGRGRQVDLERMQAEKNGRPHGVVDPDFEFGVDKTGQDIEWGKRNGTGRARWGFSHVAGSTATRVPPASPACLLFWLGFVAPWCWLIAGWCLSSRSGQMKETEGQYVYTVDRRTMWWPRRSSGAHARRVKKRREGNATEKGPMRWLSKFRGGQSNAIASGPPANGLPTSSHVEGVSETSPMTPVEAPTTDSDASVHALYSFHLSPDGSVLQSKKTKLDNRGVEDEESVEVKMVVDPWVRRCRIAAISSGIILSVSIITIVVAVVLSRK